ncbi:MAG TPA: hypothetical protein VD908_06030 [Cytophagales bacterium]|nr:hypothetical protein [Cytophagales bacterium]
MKAFLKIFTLTLILTVTCSALVFAGNPKNKKRKKSKATSSYSSKHKYTKINDCSKMGKKKKPVAILNF